MVRQRRGVQVLGTLVAGLVSLIAAATDANAATCGARNFVDRMSVFMRGTVRVTSGNGETYTDIAPGSFDGDYSITLCGDGALSGVVVHLGQCSGHDRGGCTLNPILYQEFPSARSLSKKTPTFAFAPPPDSDAGQSILKTCNAHADEQRGAARDKEIFPGFFSITLGVETRRDAGALGGGHSLGNVASGVADPADHRPLSAYSKTTTGQLTLTILCAPLPAPIKAPPKINGAQLAVATFGDTCPKPAAATVMIDAAAPRPIFYKIERGNGTTTTDDWIAGKIKLRKGPDGQQRPFLTAQHELPALDPGTRKFRLWIDTWGKTPWRTVEVGCPPFKITSAWLKYDVEDKDTCPKQVVETAVFKATRPGKAPFEIKTQGGLVVHGGTLRFERNGDGYVARAVRPNLMMFAFDSDMMAVIKSQPDANSGWVRLKVDCLEALTGKLTLRSLGATSCRGEALVAIHTNGAGTLPYELECGPGRSWQRNAAARGNKIGVDKMQFEVRNSERISCTLRTRLRGKIKSLDSASRVFRCHTPPGVSGGSGLVPETRSDGYPPVAPPPPRIVADPPEDGSRACLPHTVGSWPNCKPGRCPTGTAGTYPDCRRPVRVNPPRCPSGTVGRPPDCRPRPCPTGTIGTHPDCRRRVRPDPARCPGSMVGRPPSCRCPPGQVRLRARCIKPAR